MDFGSILNTLLIGPLKLIFELLFSFAHRLTENVGLSIIILSLAINLLVLPLYRCADAMQEKAQKREAELREGVTHIKKTFSGNERMMMLDTFYKQNNYSPFSALSGMVSLLLEIPFFIAAYQFLSSAVHLQGTTLGPIADLAKPDALLSIGSLSINVLPFLMTIINIIASVIFLEGAPLKSKIQLYLMALVFLILLYTSPAGLVFYWTLNNLFSLIKNILYKLKNPKKIIVYGCSVVGILVFALVLIFFNSNYIYLLASTALMVVLQVPIALYYLKKKIKLEKKQKEYQPNKKLFIISAIFMSILTGLFIPSIFIADNPAEFVDMANYLHPNWYLLSSMCLSFGTFTVWFSVFYWLAPLKGRVYFERAMIIASVIMLVNYFCFGTNLGNINSSLIYDNTVWFSVLEYILNAVVIIGLAVGLYFLIIKFKKITSVALVIITFAVGATSAVNFVTIANATPKKDASAETIAGVEYNLELSQSGKNVIVIMLDRALGSNMPFIQKEMQMRAKNGVEGADDFLTGFTYYSNVISYGNHTNFAAPALLGGYEYTPVEINKRDSESIAHKFNQANLVMPRMFTEQGIDGVPFANKASIFDPVYTNNSWIADLSVYEDTRYNPNHKENASQTIKAENTIGAFLDDDQRKATVDNRKRDFFVFSLMKSLPLPIQPLIYNYGAYSRVGTIENQFVYSSQVTQKNNLSHSTGMSRLFMENYNSLIELENMTNIKNDGNKFVFFRNDVTHEPMLVDENTYEPAWSVDNAEYDRKYADRFAPITNANGVTYSINVESVQQMAYYQTNVMALLKLESWFDYLKANDMYDNSRIIIASDHGYDLGQVDLLDCDGLSRKDQSSAESYFPLLLVKDFNEKGELKQDGTFMTNADLPYLAVNGNYSTSEKLISNPINPFTNKQLSIAEKTAHAQYIIRSQDWNPNSNNGNSFKSAKWIAVEGSLWDMKKWTVINKQTVLKEHKNP